MSRGLGIDFPSTTRADGRPGPRSASAGTLPIQGSETLLWAYAQVVGNFECDDRIVDSVVLASIRTKLTRSGPVGAGRMDLYDQTPGSTRGTGSGWSSFLGFRSPRATPPAPGSFFSGLFSNRSSPAMNNSSDTSGEAIPILVPSQIVLAVDLTLAPGESKTFWLLALVEVLYDTAARDPSVQYNLLWPSTQLGTSEALAFVKDAQYQSKKESKTKGLDSIEGSELLKFSEDLLRSGPGAGETFSQVGDELEDNKSGDNSRLAVEILTRQAKTASFDVHRGGASFASLMLPKTTLRLGETVQGVVIFNRSLGSIRVVKLDCFLETYETLPEMLVATLPKKSGTRRVQSEQHSDMVLHLQRTSFSLDIPSDASPSFSIHLAGDKGNGGLEWKLRVCFLVCQEDSSMESVGPGGEWGNSFSAGDGSGLGQLETVECEIPVFVLPAHTVFGSTPVSFSI
ncbi:hypothetical protein FRC17_001171 [Serendipita sp. 399]|nr:hypothetical protein FRC17_001171 [Serendipita sp. 399]